VINPRRSYKRSVCGSTPDNSAVTEMPYTPRADRGVAASAIKFFSDRRRFLLESSYHWCYIKPMADHTDLWTDSHLVGGGKMLLRTDPFRDLDRFAQQVWGTAARPAVMPMDAWREGDQFIVEFDLPGVNGDSLGLDVERNVLTVHAERSAPDPNREMVSAERPRGVFSRQVFLGDNLDADRIEASYHDGVLQLRIPVAEKAKPRRIEISHNGEKKPINA
jgi:HSP20 family protein